MDTKHIIELNKSRRNPSGWKCSDCSEQFETKAKLYEHRHKVHNVKGSPKIHRGIWNCKYCNEVFRTRSILFIHYKECEEKNKLPKDSLGRVIVEYDRSEQVKKAIETKKKKGTLSHPCSAEDRAKKAEAMIRYRKKVGTFYQANVSIKACEFIDELNKVFGWDLKHGLNGKEKRVGPYFLDGYDEQRNIAFEYDEKYHHRNKDIEERDKLRQEFIISQLNCEFWRYDEKTDTLYKVNSTLGYANWKSKQT